MAGSEPWTTSPIRDTPRAAGVARARCCRPCYNGDSRNEPDGVKPGGEIRVRESAGLKLVALVPVGFFIFWRDGKGSLESSCSPRELAKRPQQDM
jgi:hypothetical protein